MSKRALLLLALALLAAGVATVLAFLPRVSDSEPASLRSATQPPPAAPINSRASSDPTGSKTRVGSGPDTQWWVGAWIIEDAKGGLPRRFALPVEMFSLGGNRKVTYFSSRGSTWAGEWRATERGAEFKVGSFAYAMVKNVTGEPPTLARGAPSGDFQHKFRAERVPPATAADQLVGSYGSGDKRLRLSRDGTATLVESQVTYSGHWLSSEGVVRLWLLGTSTDGEEYARNTTLTSVNNGLEERLTGAEDIKTGEWRRSSVDR